MPTHVIFTYGALMSPEIRKWKDIDIIRENPYHLRGWETLYERLVPNKKTSVYYDKKYPETKYPMLTMLNICKNNNKSSYGKLIWVNDQNLEKIKKLEEQYEIDKCKRSSGHILIFITKNKSLLNKRIPANSVYKRIVEKERQKVKNVYKSL